MIHTFNENKISKTIALPVVLGIILLAVILGVGTGFGASALTGGTASTTSKTTKTEGTKGSSTAGVKDNTAFPDEVEGTLREGGLEGEGNFHLERPGGESQNVYLTSSTVDLSQFIGKKVMVWGQTFEAEKAGWLMDVGYVELK